MSKLCTTCGKAPARYRVRWDGMIGRAEVATGAAGSHLTCYCLPCGVAAAEARTEARQEREAAWRLMDWDARQAYRSDVPLPRDWQVQVDAELHPRRRLGARVTHGGDIRHGWRELYLWIEVIPPRDRPASWSAAAALYAVRYRARLPLVFVPEPLDRSPLSVTDRYPALPIVQGREE
jgi:hypothetical protein